jgi:N-methylhydantoinase A
MMAFGGAGPIHAAGVARTLGIRQVLIPRAPGVFSALGLLHAEVEHHSARTVLTATSGDDMAPIEAALEEMRADLLARVREEGLDAASAEISRFADLRYRGQSSELTVPMPDGALTQSALRTLEERFEHEFERTYAHRGDTKAFELVTVRLVLRVARAVQHGTDWTAEPQAKHVRRSVYFGPEHGRLDTEVLSRQSLGAAPRRGPLLIQEYDTTIVVPPGCEAGADRRGNVLIAIGA